MGSVLALSGCSQLSTREFAGLQVQTPGSTSVVFLNEMHLNTSPLIERQLAPGTYQLRVVPDKDELETLTTEVRLTAGTLTSVTWNHGATAEQSSGVLYELEPLVEGEDGEVVFKTNPENVIVKFAEIDQAFAPVTFSDLSPGSYEYEMTLPAHQTQQHTVNVPAGYRVIITATIGRLSDSLDPLQTEADTE
jgi:hypothetical protein